MALRPQRFASLVCALVLVPACGGSSDPAPGFDRNHDAVPDDIGTFVDADHDGLADSIDINHDGKVDGPGVDTNHDGKVDALALDTDCDGVYESYDTDGDGKADFFSRSKQPKNPPAGCQPITIGTGGTGGASSTGGTPSVGGAGGSSSMGGSAVAGSAGAAGSGTVVSQLGKGMYQGAGAHSTDQYAEADVYRDGVGYKFIANGWGSGWKSHSISWNGTSFTVESLNGSQGSDYSPAGYPTMFCGLYSMKQSIGSCGLPGSVTSLKSVKTGWRWKANGNNGQYNAAWDIWLGNGNSLSAYLMVWQRDPPGQQPAGAAATSTSSITGLPGSWKIWTGNVQGHPIVSYVRDEGQDLSELEFDVLDVYRDAIKRNYNLPGTNLLAVAVGYEVWNGPITNLATEDFYVDVK